jgi:hypothetical protein
VKIKFGIFWTVECVSVKLEPVQVLFGRVNASFGKEIVQTRSTDSAERRFFEKQRKGAEIFHSAAKQPK